MVLNIQTPQRAHQKTYLRNDVKVRDQSTLQDDGNVGGVEQLDWVGGLLSTVTGMLDGEVHTKTLGNMEGGRGGKYVKGKAKY